MTESKPIANADVPEIEITDAMIEAGALAAAGYSKDFDTPESIAVEIFEAMIAVSPRAGEFQK